MTRHTLQNITCKERKEYAEGVNTEKGTMKRHTQVEKDLNRISRNKNITIKNHIR